MSGFVKDSLLFVGVPAALENYQSIEDAIASFDDEWSGGARC